jgi:hypothetical protein
LIFDEPLSQPTTDLSDLKGVSQAIVKYLSFVGTKNLCHTGEPTKSRSKEYPIAVPLRGGTIV